jgi:hypothetical protein
MIEPCMLSGTGVHGEGATFDVLVEALEAGLLFLLYCFR